MSFALPFIVAAAPYVAVGSGVLSAVGSLRQGQQQKEMYQLQAQQAQLKASRDALQYEQQANSVLDRVLQNNATAAAKGFAGGVSGFSGSAKLIQERSTKVAGRDVGVLQEGARSALSFGDVQSIMLNEAASDAVTGSYFDAIGKLGVAAAAYAKNFPGETTTDTAAA
jgi:hypothetical protein